MTTAVEEDKALAADILRDCFGKDGNFTVTVVEELLAEGGRLASEVKRVEFKPVWRSLLARWSPVFDKMVNSERFTEAAHAQVVIEDFSAAAVEIFLRFFYSGVVEGPLTTLVEVGKMADKYQVDQLHTLCTQAVRKMMKPEVACELFACADRLEVPSLRREALEQIWIHPKAALKIRPNLRPRLLEEILDSPLLCVDDDDLVSLLNSWGHGKKRKAAAAATTEQDELQPIIDSRVAELRAQKPRKSRQHSVDVLQTLWCLYEEDGSRGTFLGYWVTIIPGQLKGPFAHDDLSALRDYASNSTCLCLGKGWLIWMLPHFSVYLTGFSFCSAMLGSVHFQILCSNDGCNWHVALASNREELKAWKPVACEKPPHLVKWFKLEVLEGEFNNDFCIHGILQED